MSILLFMLALFSKSVTCTLPAALLLVAWWKRPKLEWKRDVLPLTPMFALGALMGLVTIWMEKTNVGAQGADWALSWVERCLIAGRAVWFYAGKLVWPEPLAFNYAKWNMDPAVWWQYLPPMGALVLLIGLWVSRTRIGRGPVVAAAFFVLTLAPALGFIDYYPMIYSFVADHFQYLASIGLIAAAAAAIQNSKFRIRYAMPVVMLILAVLTWRQANVYRDLKTLWTDTLRKNPDSWLAHNNLGSLLTEEGNVQLAYYHFQEALRLNPRYDNIHYNMGIVFDLEGKSLEAISHYREALRLNPDSAQAHNNLGRTLAGRGDLELGLIEFKRALAIKPDYAKAHNNLGLLLTRKGDFDRAAAHYLEAIRIDPEFVDPYNNLGVLRARQGNFEEATEHFQRGLKVMPASAQLHSNLARTLSKRGDLDGARAHYQEALRIQPGLQEAQEGLLHAQQQIRP
jgi:Tfp pilus assembly protein PilF